MNLRLDCRHFRGDKPCRFACGCEGCAHYEPMGKRILIIKLDAIGDVARTTPLLEPLRRRHSPCHITWLVAPAAHELLKGNPSIDALLPYTLESLESLRVQSFDLALCLDKTPRAAAVGTWVEAGERLGFGLSKFGTVFPLNPEAEYAFQLGLDDNLKFRRNTKTYQEVIFDCARLPWKKEEYALPVSAECREKASAKLKALGVRGRDRLIGLNLGGGSAFAHKMWGAPEAVAFLRALRPSFKGKVLLLGAERERETMEEILNAELPDVLSAGTDNSIPEFQAILGRCDVVVTGDSLGMHLAIAERRPVVVLFGPTCAQEIELYGRGEKIVSRVSCAPCYRGRCDRRPNCMESIRPAAVLAAAKRWLPRKR